jgi:hypothetical protein
MNLLSKKKIVLLGMMSKFPVAGEVWATIQYLVGFQRLGYDVYYVEAHASTPSMLMERAGDDSSAKAANFIAQVMQRFDLSDRWAFHALHDNGRCFGMSESQLMQLYRSAALLINYHGGTMPLAEHTATGRLIYLETDPVRLQVELWQRDPEAIAFLAAHSAFFTWALNYGKADCKVPLPENFHYHLTLPPIVGDLWQPHANGARDTFTTIGNWRQPGAVKFKGEIYHWSKHHEFLKFLDLPRRTTQGFELALSSASYHDADKRLIETNGWKIRDALEFSGNEDAYRDYIKGSRGEFTVAKDQNIRLRSGWFSERSAQYLAAGRPVITQDTGFGSILPTGQGLFAFSTMQEILEAVDSINSDYDKHCRAASTLAREYFSYDVVLKKLLAEVGL